MRRRRVDDARVHWRASESHQDQASQRERGRAGQEHSDNSCCDDRLSEPDHLDVVELYREKTAQSTSDRDTDIEQAGEAGGCLCRNPLEQIQVAACPQPGCLFQRAVAEEAQHDFFCAWDPYDLAQG